MPPARAERRSLPAAGGAASSTSAAPSFSLFRGRAGGGGGVRKARVRLEAPRPGPAHLEKRVGSDEVRGGLRQLHSPPLNQQRHSGDGGPGGPREASASPATGCQPPPRPPPPPRVPPRSPAPPRAPLGSGVRGDRTDPGG